MALIAIGDVLDLVGDRAAVDLAQLRENVGEGLGLEEDVQNRSRDAGHHRLREAKEGWIERGPAFGLRAEGVKVGRHMTVRAVVAHLSGGECNGLQELLVWRSDRCRRRAYRGGCHCHRYFDGKWGEGDSEAGGDLLVEIPVTGQEHVDLAQEGTALGTLNDAVVVGARDRHHLADTKFLQACWLDAVEAHGVGDRSGGNDGALADHEAGNGCDGAKPAWVRQADARPTQFIRGDLPDTRAGDQVLERGVEAIEAKCLGSLDHRNEQ